VRSLWLEEALASSDAECPPLLGDEGADICIVGGGFTGLWSALRLKEHAPSLDVVLLEADICGGGASGRNGGFVLTWWSKFTTLKKLCGTEEAVRLAKASEDAVHEIGRLCEATGIDAHYRPCGWLWAATSPAQIGAWEETVAEAARAGAKPFRQLEAEEVSHRAGSPKHVAGVFEESAATIQPALLARGLRRIVLERGVRIFERSPMTVLGRGRPLRVRSTTGSVTAEKVILALNA
jgi:glycine/D-amino acid oxidase-like deaminating enzyme